MADVGVDSRVNPTEAEQEEVEVRSHSSTELIESDVEGQEVAVEVPDVAPSCEFSISLQQTRPARIASKEIPTEARLVWTLR